MNQQDKIRILAKKLGVFVNKNLQIFDTKEKETRTLLKHCKDDDELLDYLMMMSSGNIEVNLKIKTSDIEITERDLACLYSKTHIPMDHQIRYFQIAKDKPYFANFSEMGLGKTLMILMETGYKYDQKEIDSLVIVAPNGVHRQWISNSIEEHLPDRFNPTTAIWTSSPTQYEKFELNQILLKKTDGLKILSVNVEGLGHASKRSYEYLDSFMSNHKVFFVVDESTRIKNHKAKRTKSILRLSEKAVSKRILSGLYIPNGPLDLYSQFLFLNKTILGYNSFVAFKSRYAVENNPFLKRQLEIIIGNKAIAEKIYNERIKHFIDPARLKILLTDDYLDKFQDVWSNIKKSFLIVSGYKNIEELSKKIEPYSFRTLKEECLDLAPKIYKVFDSSLSEEQRKIYNELETELISEINNQEVVIDHVLKKLNVLRQVCGGTFKNDKGIPGQIGKKVPRIELLIEILNDIDLKKDKVIIWCCYKGEEAIIRDRLKKEFGEEFFSEIHGDIKGAKREEEIDRFNNDNSCRILLGTQSSGGIGRNLTAGNYMIFYSQTHDLEIRRQAEDREHRKGQTKTVVIIDLITKGLIDEITMKALIKKQKLADIITKDPMCWKPNLKF